MDPWNQMNYSKDTLIRIFSKIKKPIDEINDCWEWLARKDKDGYGRLRIQTIQKQAHRVLYECYNGPILNKLLVCHKCDNPSCVNPNHLFLGTQQDNLNDMANKGKSTKGSKNHHSKLTEEIVRQILKDTNENKYSSITKIAEKFSIDKTNIQHIFNGKQWNHISKDFNLDFLKKKIFNIKYLTSIERNDIYWRYLQGESKRSIAEIYNIDRHRVSNIIRKESDG